MNKNRSDFLFIQRWIILIAGFAAIIFGGFYFFNVSAQTEDIKKPAEQNLVLGRLVYETNIGTQSGGQPVIRSANADGTGEGQLTSFPPSAYSPDWSPDGTKIVYSQGDSSSFEIYAMDSNGGNKTNLTNTASVHEFNPSWSVTGKIAYERSGQIWIMNADGTNQMPFAGITQPSPTSPVWSSDGTKLAFVSGGEIWKINADGTNEQRVTTNTTADEAPSWSPDGTKIVFGKGGSGIAVVNADGTNEMNLTTVSGDAQPDWSPDGTTIAFRGGTAPGGIFLMDTNGGNRVAVVPNTGSFPLSNSNANPAWQPVAQTPNTFIISGRVTYNNVGLGGANVNLSGTTNASTTTDAVGNYQFSGLPSGGNYTVTPSRPNYLFSPANRSFNNLTSNQTGNFEVAGVCITAGRCVKNGKIAFVRSGDIYTINPDGTNQTNITNSAPTDSEPNWSPFGSSIIFSTNRDVQYEIYRMNADGTNLVNLTNNTASDSGPAYSPDGASIVFTSNRDGNYEIYKMNSDGSNQVRLTNSAASDTGPAFSPDGQKIVFASFETMSRKLMMMNADGSNPQTIPGTETPIGGYGHPSYSPDGTKIIFTFTADTSSQYSVTWTMNPDGTNRVKFPADGRDGAYSPDGTKVVYDCCEFNQTNRLSTSNAAGGDIQVFASTTAPASGPAWQPIPVTRRTTFDYDGDSRADISVFRPSENKWYILQSSTLSLRDQIFAVAGDIPVPADYDGDGKTDVAIFRPSSGDWWYLSSINNAQIYLHWGQSGDIPRPSDFDGDGKADFVIYRPSNSVWYRFGSTGATSILAFGIAEDKPLIGDFDGDGKSDPAVFRPSTGDWWYAASSAGGQHRAVHWGASGDVPTPGDYDGDGKTDFVVFRPTDGGWYILYSTGSYTIATFGTVGDKPIAADYDGDGRADIGVFRPSSGDWYLLRTTAGFGVIHWGISTDIPTENAFLP